MTLWHETWAMFGNFESFSVYFRHAKRDAATFWSKLSTFPPKCNNRKCGWVGRSSYEWSASCVTALRIICQQCNWPVFAFIELRRPSRKAQRMECFPTQSNDVHKCRNGDPFCFVAGNLCTWTTKQTIKLAPKLKIATTTTSKTATKNR